MPRRAASAREPARGGALDQRHLAAQPAHGLSHLGADRAATEDQETPRDGLHAGHLTVGPESCSLARPGMGGITGSEPVARTM